MTSNVPPTLTVLPLEDDAAAPDHRLLAFDTNASLQETPLGVHLFAVGHGQCVLATCDGRTVAVDCGSMSSRSLPVRRLLAVLPRPHLDLLVLTHGDHDHWNGLPELLQRVHVARACLPDHPAMLAPARLLERAGWHAQPEGLFIARTRHVEALKRTRAHLDSARELVARRDAALDLLAEDLRLAHDSLGEITGACTPDDLLGEIFGRFCIGK